MTARGCQTKKNKLLRENRPHKMKDGPLVEVFICYRIDCFGEGRIRSGFEQRVIPLNLFFTQIALSDDDHVIKRQTSRPSNI